MQLANVTQPFRLTVTDFTPTSLQDARPKIESLATSAGVTIGSYAVDPFVLESLPTQSIVRGTFSGPSDAVASALALLEELDSQI